MTKKAPTTAANDGSSVTMKNHHLPPENLRPTRLRHISKLASPMGIARGLVNLFSSSTHQRPRPKVMDNATTVQHLRFISVGVSHFCEKARWALDLLQAQSLEQAHQGEKKTVHYYYTEDAHAPPFVSFASVPASGDQASQTPMVIFTDDPSRNVLFGSTTVLRELCPFLYPPQHYDEIVALEDDLGTRLGATARCVVYHHLLQPQHHDACKIVCGSPGTSSTVESKLFGAMLDKGVAKAMRKVIHVNEDSAAASLVVLRQVFGDVSKRLESQDKGNKTGKDTTYLIGDTFTTADLTFAALSYPVLQPTATAPLMGHIRESQMPPALVALRDELRATRAGKHALQMYRQHRFFGINANNDTNKVIALQQSMNRNQWLGMRRLGILAVGVGLVAVAVQQGWTQWRELKK